MTDEAKKYAYGIGKFGDLMVTDEPPIKLGIALEVISQYLHQGYDFEQRIEPGKSKESCILMAATVRDFLYRVGFRDATMRSVVFWIEAIKDDKIIRQLGVGNPLGPEHAEDKFDGHMVVITEGWLIDPTMFHATPRPDWPDFPTMMAVTLYSGDPPLKWFDLPILCGCAIPENEVGNMVRWAWLDQPDNDDWQKAGDFTKKFKRERVTDLMVTAYRTKLRLTETLAAHTA